MPLDDIHIIDDFISEEYQNLIEDVVFGEDIDYKFIEDVGHINSKKNKNFGFCHLFRDETVNFPRKPVDYFFAPLIHDGMKKIERKVSFLKRGRIFLTTPSPNLNQDVYHIDIPTYHIAFIYYVNTCDGGTTFTNNFLPPEEELKYLTKYYEVNEMNVYKQVESKKGRAVIFNGLRYHSSYRPTNGIRAVVNFNLI